MSVIEIILCVIFGSFFYVLLGVLMFCLVQLFIDDFCNVNFELNKYMFAISVFWPLIPFIFIVLGVIKTYQLLRLLIKRSQWTSEIDF